MTILLKKLPLKSCHFLQSKIGQLSHESSSSHDCCFTFKKVYGKHIRDRYLEILSNSSEFIPTNSCFNDNTINI